MAFTSTTRSLSALSPVKLTYKFNKEEKLSNSLTSLNNGLSFYRHNVLSNARDAVFSNHNLLILTDNMPLKEVFEVDSSNVPVGTIAGSMYLRDASGRRATYIKNNICMGGVGQELLLAIVPIENNIVELIVSETKKVMIDEDYPYTAKISSDILTNDKLYRQRFEMDLKDGLCSFKVLTKEGYRFLSFGVDNVLRAVGIMLNEVKINSYLFVADFATNETLRCGFDAKTSEIKYYNDFASFSNKKTVNIKTEQESNTNLLISCATLMIAASAEVPVNIALTKTNFSSSGSYSTKQT
jgi:hypothetical protein